MARAATAPARPVTAPRTRPRPVHPRRRSGATIPRVLEAPTARLLDALLLGRTWIVTIGVLLAGIVFLQVSLLGLNQGITRDSARAQTLAQQNAQLRLAVARLASSDRIQQLAEKRGMVMPAPAAVTYLRAHRSDAKRAAQATQQAPAPQSATPQSAIQTSAVPTPTAPAHP